MSPQRTSISRLMVGIALLGLDIGLIRAFLVEDRLAGALLIALVLQLALWRYLRTRRRFWLGFVVGGSASVLGLIACELVPGSLPARWVTRYLMLAYDLSQRHSPTTLDDLIMDHQVGFQVVVFFVPELAAAILGGLLFGGTGALMRRRRRITARSKDHAQSP